MSGALAVVGSVFASDAGADCCDSPHPTITTAAIVVSRRCFISLQLSAFPTLAAVLAEEVGDFGIFELDGPI
jgi:hypothetical protein